MRNWHPPHSQRPEQQDTPTATVTLPYIRHLSETIRSGSCFKVYIGQTGRTLEHRLKEHKRALTSGNPAQSAVAEHAVDHVHEIDWKEAEVVDSHPYYRQRCALEAWHIRTEHQTMNRDEYNPLIRRLRPAAV